MPMLRSLGSNDIAHPENMMRLIYVKMAALALLFAHSHAGIAATLCAPVLASDNAQVASILSTLAKIKEKLKLNAIIFSAEKDGKPIVRTALGISKVGEPATTEMHFRIGGVGWQHLSATLLRLVDQKKIALTDLASKWYPKYPHADRTTVRMLAASSAGFGDYITPPAFVDKITADPLHVWTADELIERSIAPYQKPQFTNPGHNWMYSHTDFVMLGAILEKVSGKPYGQLLKELILEPLGLHNTRLQFDAKPQQPVLHTLAEETFQDSTYWNPSFVSWAALTANICDLSTWIRAYGNGALLSPESKKEITSPVNVGLGPFKTKNDYFGLGALIHGPWIVARAAYWGMHTTTAFDPITGIGLSVTTSLSPASPADAQPANEIIAEISRLLSPSEPVPK